MGQWMDINNDGFVEDEQNKSISKVFLLTEYLLFADSKLNMTKNFIYMNIKVLASVLEAD